MSKRDAKAQSIWELASPELRAELLKGARAKLYAKIADRERAETLLAQSSRAISRAYRGYVANATSAPFMRHIRPLLARGDVPGVMALIDLHVGAFANRLAASFVATANAECAALSGRLIRKAPAPAISLSFNVADPRAVRLMQQNRLRQINGLNRMQQERVRAALVRSVQEGLGTSETSRLLQRAIGLDPQQERHLEGMAARQRALRADDLEVEEGLRAPIFTDRQIDEMVERETERALRVRADRIARTESLVIPSQGPSPQTEPRSYGPISPAHRQGMGLDTRQSHAGCARGTRRPAQAVGRCIRRRHHAAWRWWTR
jgi:hypothetical protein